LWSGGRPGLHFRPMAVLGDLDIALVAFLHLGFLVLEM